jgi:hypothetical protein
VELVSYLDFRHRRRSIVLSTWPLKNHKSSKVECSERPTLNDLHLCWPDVFPPLALMSHSLPEMTVNIGSFFHQSSFVRFGLSVTPLHFHWFPHSTIRYLSLHYPNFFLGCGWSNPSSFVLKEFFKPTDVSQYLRCRQRSRGSLVQQECYLQRNGNG